jgi:biopolymer transport protein ExbB
MRIKTFGFWVLVAGIIVCAGQTAMAADTAATEPAHYGSTTFAMGFKWLLEIVLVLMSFGGTVLIFDAIIQIREGRIMPAATTERIRALIAARQFKELMEFTATDQSFVAASLNAGLRRARQGFGAMRDGVESTAAEQSANWFRRIEFLNIIGNLGPLVGLMGTVLGMIIAFNEIGDPSKVIQGADKVNRLAPGISTALWHTFGGLFVAIPCLMVFGYYRTRVDQITMKASLLADELIESMRPAEATPEPEGAPRRPLSATMEAETTTA